METREDPSATGPESVPVLKEKSETVMVRDMPEQDRPRERLLRVGAENLKDEELLAIILRMGPPGMSVLDLARKLLHTFGNNLATLADASIKELTALPGIGPVKATELKATFSLAKRMAEFNLPERSKLATPDVAARYLQETFRGKKQEEMHVILLDIKNRLIRDVTVTVGLVDRSQIHAREVFRPAIEYGAAKILLAHNHPSGDPKPSKADIICTETIVQAGKLMEIPVVDHLIVVTRSDNQDAHYFSFREHDLID